MMETKSDIIRNCAVTNDDLQILELLNSGLDPNHEGGWPIRLAARYGSYNVVKILIHYGANPHLLGEAGASTLQLAVFSGLHWETDNWSFLLSCYDSSQLADGAAVAIIFQNTQALKRILQTGRCNSHIPTTLTGKTLEQLAKGYKLQHLLNMTMQNDGHLYNATSPIQRSNALTNTLEIAGYRSPIASSSSGGQLSPSVARFFNQTAGQSTLTSPRNATLLGPPYYIP